MNQKIALVVYPEFSFQEIGNLSSLFRWGFDTRTVVVSGDKNPVRSEEGFAILPDITYEEFCVEEYDCLIYRDAVISANRFGMKVNGIFEGLGRK